VKWKAAFLFSLVVFFSGCALSPQQIVLTPEIQLAVQDTGRQRDIAVWAEDNRQNAVVGTRGGVYHETSTIELSSEFTVDVTHELAAALTRWSFVSHVGEADRDMGFVLKVDEVSYTPDRTIAGKVKINVALTAVVKNGWEEYTGNYSANGEMAYVTMPSEAKNNKQVSEIFNLALAQVFADPNLQAFLEQ